jgi:hypothetical protein
MPILNDIPEHEVLAREYEKGRREVLLRIIHLAIKKGFGMVPGWQEELLATKTVLELEHLCVQALDAQDLDELLGQNAVTAASTHHRKCEVRF